MVNSSSACGRPRKSSNWQRFCSVAADSYAINGQGQLWNSSTPEAELSAPFASRDVIGAGVVAGKKQIFLTYILLPSGDCSHAFAKALLEVQSKEPHLHMTLALQEERQTFVGNSIQEHHKASTVSCGQPIWVCFDPREYLQGFPSSHMLTHVQTG